MRYRVDNIPPFLKPFFLLYSYVLGFLFFLAAVILHFLCRIRVDGAENLEGRGNFIFCMWHDNVFPYFASFLRHRRPHMWMNHPAWYMKPIHVNLALIGVKGLVLGSTGHDGQEAAARLVGYLKEGYSTLMMPDGPAGPPKVLKKGVLHIALQSGVPIVPMKILTPHRILLKSTWEGKRIPLPFSTIRVVYGEPITVTEGNFDRAVERLTEALGY
jgi:lysophospholipid acyltransferase (LPLAT)-like uncharacterized protein